MDDEVNDLQPLPEGTEMPGQSAPRDEEIQEEAGPPEEHLNPEPEEDDGDDAQESEADSRSGKSRIREQSDTIRAQRERIKTLESQIGVISGEDMFDEAPPLDIFNAQVAPGTEITADQYKQDVTRTADALVTLRLKQTQNASRIKTEVIEAITEHPELNDKSEVFDQDLSDTVTEAVSAFVKSNPTGSVKDYINKMMKPYKRSIEKGVNQQTETIAKQVSQAALRPTQVKGTSTKKFADLSLDEMKKKLGVVY